MSEQYEGLENKIYDGFPRGDSDGSGPEDGFNTYVRLNDEDLFTDKAREHPAIRAFLEAPFIVRYAQFKSSHSETEYWLHKPLQAMGGEVEGIQGTVGELDPDTRIVTMVMNHERTLARHITRTIVVDDREGKSIGQIIHKEEKPEG
jgi:hypothetical protein